MAPKSKSAPRNAFYFFMLDFKDRQGRKYNSMKEVADVAGPHWARMSEEQKRPYKDRAAAAKNTSRKFTSEGIDIEELNLEMQAQEARLAEMKEDILTELKMYSKLNRIDEQAFYFIHFNNFCFKESENMYYPAEVALLGFNLRDGVNLDDVYHKMLKPGELPLGYGFTAKQHSDETHKLPPPMHGDIENNMEECFFEIVQYLQDRTEGSQRLPVLYTDEKYMTLVQTILDTWSYNFQENYQFKVYNLQFLFRALKNTVAKGEVWPSDTFSAREIEKDVYCLTRDISCPYHEMTEATIFCSRSIVTRWAYMVCDNCCQDLDIIMIPGCHIPASLNTMSDAGSEFSFKSSSKKSSKPSKMSSRRSDDSRSVASVCSMSSDSWEVESTQSETSSFSGSDCNFPTLGNPRFENASPARSLSGTSRSSTPGFSYAGASAGLSKRPPSMPSSVLREMGNLKLEQEPPQQEQEVYEQYPVLGRGRKILHESPTHFPALGRGARGRRVN